MKKNLGKIVAGAAILLGLIAVLLIFAPAVVPKEGKGDPMGGASLAFGNKDDGTAFSAYVLAFAFPLVGVILSVLALLGKGGKIVPIAAAVCFLVGGIFYFLPIAVYQPYISESASKLPGFDKAETVKAARELLEKFGKVGLGAIFGGIFSILAACASAATLVLNKK